jgi:hypothetical protein
MKHLSVFLSTILVAVTLQASPGAHGPNGEHLDGASSGSTALEATPRFEAFTENFELVGKLYNTELSVLVDEYTSNIPVLKAELELEVNGVKAKGTFHADANDYAFDDPKILEAFKKPGEHELIFTVKTETSSDLVLGTLVTGQAEARHSHVDEWLESPMVWGLAAMVFTIALLMSVRQRMFGKN